MNIQLELALRENSLSRLEAVMAKEKTKLEMARKMKQELDLKNHEIRLTEEQIGGNSSSSVRFANSLQNPSLII